MQQFRRLIFLLPCFVILVFYNFTWSQREKLGEDFNFLELKLEPNQGRIGFPDTCRLPEINPWNEEIMKFVDLDFHLDTGWPGFIQTSFVNSSIILEAPWYSWVNCHARCIFRESETTNRYSSWQGIDKKFDCDLVHVKCNHFLFYLFPYWYERVHTQIIPQNRTDPSQKSKKFNIFVILVDATGHSQSYRNLARTLYFMKTRFDAVSFPYVNKVGSNSKPNGFPLYFGKSIQGIGSDPPDLGDVCHVALDDFKGILDDMREEGYRTYYSDDWPVSFYTYPNCTGFKRKVADHSLMPLIREIIVHNGKLRQLYKTYDLNKESKPQRLVQVLLDSFEQFIQAYPEEPKFGWIWTAELSHDRQSTSLMLDTMLYKMLIRNQEELDNSFVFVMGDHGLTYGQELLTKTAKLDLNNPMLAVSIPKELRRTTKIPEMIRKNAQKLQTHYDTRATWLDIAKFPLDQERPGKILGEKGESYLREQSSLRTCRSLPIPPIYCICDNEKEDLPLNSTEAILMGTKVIGAVNYFLYHSNIKHVDLCGKWVFSKVISLQGLKPVNETGIYYISVGVSAPYDKAIFETVILAKKNGELEFGAIDRRDEYGHRGDCSVHSRYCDCF